MIFFIKMFAIFHSYERWGKFRLRPDCKQARTSLPYKSLCHFFFHGPNRKKTNKRTLWADKNIQPNLKFKKGPNKMWIVFNGHDWQRRDISINSCIMLEPGHNFFNRKLVQFFLLHTESTWRAGSDVILNSLAYKHKIVSNIYYSKIFVNLNFPINMCVVFQRIV